MCVPGPSDWTRFSFYANRVKTLVQSHEKPCNVEMRFLAEISLHRRVLNLFPSLSVLSWRDKRVDHFPYISLFMSPTLTKVDIEIFSDDTYIAFWDILRHSAPSIHEVYVKVAPIELTYLSLASQSNALRSLEHLTSLRGPRDHNDGGLELSPDHLSYLSRMPTLHTLQFRMRTEFHVDSNQATNVTSGERFPTLHTLGVHIHGLDAMKVLSVFLEGHQLPAMKNFRVYLYWQSTSALLRRLFVTLAKKPQLRSIAVYFDRSVTPIPTSVTYAITDQTIQPLFQLRLVVFGLIGVSHRITRKSLSNMTTAWPNLAQLSIYRMGMLGASNHIHIQDLSLIAEKLPHLHEMRLDIDMKAFDGMNSESEIPVDGIRDGSIQSLRLDIGYSRLPDTLAQTQIAAYLTNIFPNIQVQGYDDRIGEFKKLIELFNGVRASERRKRFSAVLNVMDSIAG